MWHCEKSGDWSRSWPQPDGTYAALVLSAPWYHAASNMGWRVWDMGGDFGMRVRPFAYGPEVGLEGRQKADAVLARLCR